MTGKTELYTHSNSHKENIWQENNTIRLKISKSVFQNTIWRRYPRYIRNLINRKRAVWKYMKRNPDYLPIINP